MAEVDPNTFVTVPEEVELSPLNIGKQPETDKGFTTANGTKLRARVVKVSNMVQNAPIPTNTNVAISPPGFTLSVTLAALADDLTVAKDGNGALLIMERHELIISDEAMKNPSFDPADAVDTVLRQQAYLLEQRVTKRKATADYFAANWGGSLAQAEPALPIKFGVPETPTA